MKQEKYTGIDEALLITTKKSIKKLELVISKAESSINILKKDLVARFCPHKIGDKVLLTRNNGDKKELYCIGIKMYQLGNPLKFHYEFSETFKDGYNPEVYCNFGKIEWLCPLHPNNTHESNYSRYADI